MKPFEQRIYRTSMAAVCALLAALMLLTVGAWPAFAGSLSVTGRTLVDNEAVWGQPACIQKLGDGMEKRYYKVTNPMYFGYRTFVYKDGRAVDDGGLAVDVPETRRGNTDFQTVKTDFESVLTYGRLVER